MKITILSAIKRIVGYGLIALPFVVLAAFFINAAGWVPVLAIFATVTAILTCVAVGFWLIE